MNQPGHSSAPAAAKFTELSSDAAVARARHDLRNHVAAVRAQSRQARRRSAELHGGEANVLLDTVVLLVTNFLRWQGFALVAPVVARFRTTDSGSTGFEVTVRLKDPSHASAAKAALARRFPDRVSEVIVS